MNTLINSTNPNIDNGISRKCIVAGINRNKKPPEKLRKSDHSAIPIRSLETYNSHHSFPSQASNMFKHIFKTFKDINQLQRGTCFFKVCGRREGYVWVEESKRPYTRTLMEGFIQRLENQGKGDGLFTSCLIHIYTIIHTYNGYVPSWINKTRFIYYGILLSHKKR